MDQKIDAYLESLVLKALQRAEFQNLPEDQKSAAAERIRNYLNDLIIDTVVDRLTPEQLNTIKDIPADSQEMEDKIEEYATQMPFLAEELEEKLNQAVSAMLF